MDKVKLLLARVVKKLERWTNPVGRSGIGKLTGRVSWDNGSQRSSAASRSLDRCGGGLHCGRTGGRCPSPDDCAQLMLDVFAQGAPQGALAEEDYLGQALLLQRPDPALRIGIQVRAARRQHQRFNAT